MTNEKVFNYVGTTGRPFSTHFEKYLSSIEFADHHSQRGLYFEIYDGTRNAISDSNNQGYKSGKDKYGKNMITGADDGAAAPIKILEVYEIN